VTISVKLTTPTGCPAASIWRDARGTSADGLTQAFGARFQIEF
jgi:hypothetical protein